jgi:hypothetical protein
VFHFVRQQYGFLRIYSRSEHIPNWARRIDEFTIYYATLYPLIYWHLGEPRHFNWFVDDDFITYRNATLLNIATLLYYANIAIYITRETLESIRTRHLNIPRVAILLGTIASISPTTPSSSSFPSSHSLNLPTISSTASSGAAPARQAIRNKNPIFQNMRGVYGSYRPLTRASASTFTAELISTFFIATGAPRPATLIM